MFVCLLKFFSFLECTYYKLHDYTSVMFQMHRITHFNSFLVLPHAPSYRDKSKNKSKRASEGVWERRGGEGGRKRGGGEGGRKGYSLSSS